MQFRWAIVDCETTGLHPVHDHITEIAILIITDAGVVKSFSSLIKPPCRISDMIASLTGITNTMIENAPSFADIAPDICDLLKDCIFVAHNARFDYGFIKSNLKRLGITISCPVLCTIKLFRNLYPQMPSCSLQALALYQGISINGQHRAKNDTFILYQLLILAQKDHGVLPVLKAANACYKKSSIPSKLATDISSLPDSPGVYLFYGEACDLPLYIGKSVSIRTRVMSHFQADHSSAKEFALAQQVRQIQYISTAGELSALLLESELIKKHLPIYNRRLRRKKTLVGFQQSLRQGYIHIEVIAQEDSSALNGAFQSMKAAKNRLAHLVKEYALCPKLCHLEASKTICFSRQLKRCHGACVQEEPAITYNLRVSQALASFKEEAWPFPKAILIKEECKIHKMTQWMKFDQWRYLGAVTSIKKASELKACELPQDKDIYRILSSYIKHQLKHEDLTLCE